MTVRSKFRLTEIITTEFGSGYQQKKYVFAAWYDESIPEDRRFAKATPSGRLEMVIDNPAAQSAFEVGKDYYFDAVPVTTPAQTV